jgi:Photoprotection regulator fluorescence recovery protein
MQNKETGWSETENNTAQEILNRAYDREILALMEKIRFQASEIVELDDIWRLHDFLSAKRHEIDGKYDNRSSVLIFVLARLLKEGWVHLDELKDLDKDKRAKITSLARM